MMRSPSSSSLGRLGTGASLSRGVKERESWGIATSGVPAIPATTGQCEFRQTLLGGAGVSQRGGLGTCGHGGRLGELDQLALLLGDGAQEGEALRILRGRVPRGA